MTYTNSLGCPKGLLEGGRRVYAAPVDSIESANAGLKYVLLTRNKTIQVRLPCFEFDKRVRFWLALDWMLIHAIVLAGRFQLKLDTFAGLVAAVETVLYLAMLWETERSEPTGRCQVYGSALMGFMIGHSIYLLMDEFVMMTTRLVTSLQLA